MLFKVVNDTNWLNTGTANAGNTGFDFLSTAQFELDEFGRKTITTAGSNTALTVRLDNPSTVFASGETRHIVRIWIRAEFDGQSNSTQIGTPSGFALDYDNGGGVRALLTLNAANNGYNAGFYLSPSGIGATATATLSGLFKEPIPVNEDFELSFWADRTSGEAGLCGNGALMAGWTATPGTWSTTININLPATPGIRWRIIATSTRPAASYIGNDTPVLPLYSELSTPKDGIICALPHVVKFTNPNGSAWRYTGACTFAEIESNGVNPNRKIMTGGVGGISAKSFFKLGDNPWNEYGDLAIITSINVPSGQTASIAIRDAVDSVDLVKLQVANGQLQSRYGEQLRASDGTAVSILDTKNYFLVINMSRNGFASWTVQDGTADTGRLIWSNAIFEGWRPGGLGEIVIAGSQNARLDRVDPNKWFALSICDSLTTAYCATYTPLMPTTANNLAYGGAHSDSGLGMPGSAYQNRWYGAPKLSHLFTGGRSGRKRIDWINNMRQYATHLRCAWVIEYDGACFNDIYNGGSLGGATADDMMAMVQSDLAWCMQNNNRLLLMPSFTRPSGLGQSFSIAQKREQQQYNNLKRAFVLANKHNPFLYYSDHKRGYREALLTTDGPHPVTGGAVDPTRAIFSQAMSAAEYAINQA